MSMLLVLEALEAEDAPDVPPSWESSTGGWC